MSVNSINVYSSDKGIALQWVIFLLMHRFLCERVVSLDLLF